MSAAIEQSQQAQDCPGSDGAKVELDKLSKDPGLEERELVEIRLSDVKQADRIKVQTKDDPSRQQSLVGR